jgi:tRNA1(Val) A37 N6-methylase TrmN6
MDSIHTQSVLKNFRNVLDRYSYWAICGSGRIMRGLLTGRTQETFRLVWQYGENLDRTRKALLLLLFFGQPVAKSTIESIVPGEVISVLVKLGLLKEHGYSLHMEHYSLIALDGAYLFVPQMLFPSPANSLYVGADSLRLCQVARVLHRGGTAFEIGAGTGIVGLIGARGPYRASEVDPWSGLVAWVNFALNDETHRCRVSHGDLFAGCPSPRLELLLANPPYLPVPDGVDFSGFAGGGSTGLDTVNRILNDLPQYLPASGVFAMVLRAFGGPDATPLEDVLQSLGTLRPITVHYLNRRRVRTADFRALAEGAHTSSEVSSIFSTHYQKCGFSHQFDTTVIVGPVGHTGLEILRNYDSWDDESVPARTTETVREMRSSSKMVNNVYRLADGQTNIRDLAAGLCVGKLDLEYLIPQVIDACRKLQSEGLLKPSATHRVNAS